MEHFVRHAHTVEQSVADQNKHAIYALTSAFRFTHEDLHEYKLISPNHLNTKKSGDRINLFYIRINGQVTKYKTQKVS